MDFDTQKFSDIRTKAGTNDWTQAHLKAFRIVAESTLPDATFKKGHTTDEAKTFLEANKEVTLASDGRDKIQWNTPFMKYSIAYMQDEGAARDLIKAFLDGVLGGRLLTRSKSTLRLSVSYRSTTPKTWLELALYPQWIVPIVVMEGVSPGARSYEATVQSSEAQTICAGIAAAQSIDWRINVPVYMLRFIDTNITVYKATFTKELLESVMLGNFPSVITRVQRLDALSDSTNGRPGFDLLDPIQRMQLTEILCRMTAEIVERFPQTSFG